MRRCIHLNIYGLCLVKSEEVGTSDIKGYPKMKEETTVAHTTCSQL